MRKYPIIVALAALLLSPSAMAQSVVVGACPNTTAIYAAGQTNRAPAIDIYGNVCGGAQELAGPSGSAAQVNLDGAVAVANVPYPQFTDTFASLDTTTNWTTNNSGGTAAATAGVLTVAGTTTASQYGGLSTQQSWLPTGTGYQTFGTSVAFNTLVVTNSVRIFGAYTSPGSPTLAAPITDGYVFRMDATGALFAEVWAAGAAVSSTNVTTTCAPAAGVYNTYYVQFRTNLAAFGCGSNPNAAIVPYLNPASANLPLSAYSIAGLSNPGAAASLLINQIGLTTTSGGAVKAPTQSATINDPSSVMQISPNGPDPCHNPSVAKSSAAINITSAATTQLVAISGTKSIYVCHFSFTISEVITTANTLQFEYGTSTNCTGTNKLTGLYGAGGISAGTPIYVSAGYGGTLFTVPSANGLCALTAIGATGSFQGVITYVQQ